MCNALDEIICETDTSHQSDQASNTRGNFNNFTILINNERRMTMIIWLESLHTHFNILGETEEVSL